MTEPIRRRDVVVRKTPAEPGGTKPVHGIVVAAFMIQEQDLQGLLSYTPAEPGSYHVVMWHSRKRPRIERTDELQKVGSLDSWF